MKIEFEVPDGAYFSIEIIKDGRKLLVEPYMDKWEFTTWTDLIGCREIQGDSGTCDSIQSAIDANIEWLKGNDNGKG